MEINLPPKDVQVEVAENNLLTLRIMEDGSIYWNVGIERPQKIAFSELRAFLQEKSSSNAKLVTLIKIDRKAKYHNMVDILDEIQLASVIRFSLAPLLEEDIKEVEKVL